MAQELDTTLAGVDETSQGEPQATAGQGQERQPVDLTKLPEFKSWQSERDRKDAFMQSQIQQEAQARRNLEAQYHQLNMSTLDETGKLNYQNQLLQQQLNEVARQRELDQFAFTRQRDLEEITRKTGVSLEEVSKFNNVHEAWSYAVEQQQSRPAAKGSKMPPKVQQDDSEVPDTVDLGSGKPLDAATRYRNEWKAQKSDFNMRGMLDAEERAIKAGVDISKW